MVQLEGKYIYEGKENIENYLKALGLDEKQIVGLVAGHKELEVKADGNNYSLSSGLGTRTFPVDKEIDESLADGNVLKSTASVSGAKLTIKSTGKDGRTGERIYEATDNGLTLSMSTDGVGGAKLFFKRA